MLEQKPAHEALVEEIDRLFGQIATLIETGGDYHSKTTCLAQSLRILYLIKIPVDKLPWVTEALNELAEKYRGKVSDLEKLILPCMEQIFSGQFNPHGQDPLSSITTLIGPPPDPDAAGPCGEDFPRPER